jgi:hypothetical protein
MRASLVIALALVAGCGSAPQVAGQPADRGTATQTQTQHLILPSPDTEDASWHEPGDDTLSFGEPRAPLLSMTCDVEGSRLVLVRHAPAPEGAKALAAFVGNNIAARWNVDATRSGGETVWKGAVPLDERKLALFDSRTRIEVTIPGAGKLRMASDPAPGNFVDRCRAAAGRAGGSAD